MLNTVNKIVICLLVGLSLNLSIAGESLAKTITCEASWYGPGMRLHRMPDGTKKPLTAWGKIFNMDDPTLVAHPSLPKGTKIRVENTNNGRTAILTVKDRGPFSKGRCLDLSRAAAKKIGMYCGPRCGTADLRVTVLPAE
jgi:rare lipoprotein A